MNYQAKDILRLHIPGILGDPPCELTFQLSSKSLQLTLPSERVYCITDSEVMKDVDGQVTLKCNDKSVILLHTNFLKLQDIYYYPFISSIFGIASFGVTCEAAPWMEVTTPRGYKSITKYCNANGEYKQFEKWTVDSGTYYFRLRNGQNSFRMTLKTDGANIHDGLAHMALPIFMIALGLLLESSVLPEQLRANATGVMTGILLAFTPMFLSNLRQFLRESFMSLTLGLFLYVHSYLISVLYICALALRPTLAVPVAIYIVVSLLVLMLNVLAYFRRGAFHKVFSACIIEPTLRLMKGLYFSAWKEKGDIES